MAKRPVPAGGGGRPSKGRREPLLTRVPESLAKAVRDEADRLDLTYSDHVANVLAAAHGHPPVAKSPLDDGQLQLSA